MWAIILGLCKVGWRFNNRISPFCKCLCTILMPLKNLFALSLVVKRRFAIASLWIASEIEIRCILPSSFSIITAPGWILGPFKTNCLNCTTFQGVTGVGYVSFNAKASGIPISSMFKLGSGVITDRAAKLTLLPIICILIIPSFFSITCFSPWQFAESVVLFMSRSIKWSTFTCKFCQALCNFSIAVLPFMWS